MRVLNAMHRPQYLFDAAEHDPITRLLPLVICREAAVVGRVPVLCRDDEIKASLQFVSERDYFMTPGEAQEYGIIDNVIIHRDTAKDGAKP